MGDCPISKLCILHLFTHDILGSLDHLVEGLDEVGQLQSVHAVVL